jgi:hypothetical protein
MVGGSGAGCDTDDVDGDSEDEMLLGLAIVGGEIVAGGEEIVDS